MCRRVLITGGAGFIGLNIAQALLRRGAEITLVDDFSRGTWDSPVNALAPHVRIIEYDLTTPIDEQVLGSDYTDIYHLAAIVGVKNTQERPDSVLRTNLLTTIHVLDWCARMNNVVLCFASSSEAYADSVRCDLAPIPTPEEVPLVISDPARSRTAYGASKIYGEQLCINYARNYDFALRIVRFHNVYGPRMGYDHVIPQFVMRSIGRADPFPIYGAYQYRAFCYITDAAYAATKVMDLTDSESLTVNIGNDAEETQIIDLARRVNLLSDYAPAFDIKAPPSGSPERRCPDLQRLRVLTDYAPEVDLDRGLEVTYEWYEQYGSREMASD